MIVLHVESDSKYHGSTRGPHVTVPFLSTDPLTGEMATPDPRILNWPRKSSARQKWFRFIGGFFVH